MSAGSNQFSATYAAYETSGAASRAISLSVDPPRAIGCQSFAWSRRHDDLLKSLKQSPKPNNLRRTMKNLTPIMLKVAAALALVASTTVNAAVSTWNGTASVNWNNAANWSPGIDRKSTRLN